MQERKVREERRPRDFYTGLLKLELHPVCQDNLSLTLHYFKRFTKYPPLHFQNMQKTQQKTLESHKNHTSTARTLLQTWKTTKHTHKAWERSNLSGSTTLPTTNHFLQASNQAKSFKNWSKINLQQLQHLWSRRREFPQVSRSKSCSKMINWHLFRKSQLL